jgi:NADPH:quinone reductase-like Zn-dependent oxidoreductase
MYGSSDVIEINQNTLSPKLLSEKVLVDIKADGVNPIDWKIREGYMKQIVPLQLPSTLGMDFSGTIKKIGSNKSSFDYKNGNEVYGQASVTKGGTGAFAEIVITDADNIALKLKTKL